MFRKKEIRAILIFVIFCFSIVLAEEQKVRTVRTRDAKTGEMVARQVPITQKQPGPCENRSVLVEVFMVRVSTEALAEVGVSSIGQAPEGISILKIIACLDDPEKAQVISGAKVMSENDKEAQVRNQETFYVQRELINIVRSKQGPVENKSVEFKPYSAGKEMDIIPRIQPDERIQLEVSYSDTGIIENEGETIPPTQLKYDWSGVLTIASGKPIIASATEDDDTVTLLILTATIQE